MKIGVFDSGLGGLVILKSLVKSLPEYDYIYLGDTQRVPYGNRSPETVYQFLEEAVDYLFKKDCALIIVACNTASAEALRKIQAVYLPKKYPNRRVLGVIIPTAEAAVEGKVKSVGVLATTGTVNSKAYVREIKKLNNNIKVIQSAAPLLVPLIENDALSFSEDIIKQYLKPFKSSQAIILGCTHYPLLKSKIKKFSGKRIISQDEIIPEKFKNYLVRHPEMGKRLSKNRRREFLVTDLTEHYKLLGRKWFGPALKFKKVAIT
ncbi:MAG: glutamate racemase [Candidatus Doudnabacteria bacterium RIFCSPHIGHO2_02_FULL_46_11]|uniref:Glutamate racemase n=1 Tax=Candidatus Doudnabacteria bacterium RIFCSPHIGHO2_02_FULL_46_11 TaxID=1817832 RepID=A0A1F5P7Z9_9BACT|nr:MAG: glutamate racemase [Candidatus Doudnabacteria bacterium RIFCSPHIGHO2_02_FULL_46_11]